MSGRPTVACVGGGVIGRSWAVAFAAGGAAVRVYDVDGATLERARRFAGRSLRQLGDSGFCDDAGEALSRIRFLDSLEDAVAEADYIQESIGEDVAAKRRLFDDLARLAPAVAVLASSTSTIPASAFLAGVEGSDRCLVVHPINPPHLIPLVEVCPAPFTSAETVARVVELLSAIGREPVVLNREVRGFIVNRLQLALIGEALHLVGEGYCSAADLDRAVRHSLGLRWALLGPFEAGHLNADGGYYEYMKKFEPAVRELIADLKVDYKWSEKEYRRISLELSQAVGPEDIPQGQARRDSDFLALLGHLRRR